MPDRHNKKAVSSASQVVRGLLGMVATAVGAWIGYSALLVNHRMPLPPAIDAQRERYLSRWAGLLSYYRDTSAAGRPVVLVHSVNAAASAYEMRPLFNHFRTTRPVYALELPGFGFSERSNRDYTPQLYAEAILDFLTHVVIEPADVVTLSLSSEFAALAALENAEQFHTLSMISPSGFTARRDKVSSQRARQNGMSDRLYNLFTFPLWARAFFDLLATMVSIRFFLKQSFDGPVEPALAGYSYATAHQPGAHYAPLHFVSGRLFTPDIRQRAYEHLTCPVMVIYDQDPYVRFDTLDEMVASHFNWRSQRITPTRGLPQFERLVETAAALDDFWTMHDPPQPEQPNVSGWVAQDSD